MQETIRAFIAIHLPREVTAYLGRLSADLAAQVPQRRNRPILNLAAGGVDVWTRVAVLGAWLVFPGLWGAILSSAFGSALSVSQYYCRTCRTVFEWMKWREEESR